MLSSLYAKGIAVVAVLACVYFGYRYVDSLQEQAAEWQARAVSLEYVVRDKEIALRSMREGIERQQRLHDELERSLSSARAEVNHITKVFGNHDFSKLLAAKPGLVHKRMRDATSRVFESFAEAGSDY